MKAIVVTDQSMGTAEMKLVERPEPRAAINDVVVQIYPSGFVPNELAWPSIWTDRLDRDRTPSVPRQELAGVVTALGYAQRVSRWDSGCLASPTGIATARWRSMSQWRHATSHRCQTTSTPRWRRYGRHASEA
jgi:NADPH:quinone reductase-like Zn-dependent oxidoreductase